MKVSILGTGSIYSKSNCTSLIIDNTILVDLGPGVIKQLLKQNYSLGTIHTILITHLHSDHILDFPTLIVNIESLKTNHNITIYCPNGGKEKLLTLLTLMYGNYFDSFIDTYLNFEELSDNKILSIENYTIEVSEMIHTGIESYGFSVNKQLGITGDSSLCNSVKRLFNESKILVCDCSLIHGDIYHMGVNNIKYLLKLNNQKKIIATHLSDSTKEQLKSFNLNNVFVVEDGYEFIVEDL